MSALTFQLFAKAPIAGKVKTRLYPALDPGDAATLHARMILHTARVVAAARDGIPGSRAELWCSPDTTSEVLQTIAHEHGLALRQQATGDIGMRMRHALWSAMPGRVVLLGSDCPPLDAAVLIAADRALGPCDAVFVPVEDGGYALIGCRDEVPDCFLGIAWSTGGVMAQTRARMTATGTRWLELPLAWDVDTPADLARLGADVRFAHLLAGLVQQRTAKDQQQPGQPL